MLNLLQSDVIKVANGEYKEILPLRVRPRVSIIGESLRNCRISPTTGKGTQIKTVKLTNNFASATDGEYKYKHPSKVEKTVLLLQVHQTQQVLLLIWYFKH